MSTSATPQPHPRADLADLRHRYLTLPPRQVRYKTSQGRDFLDLVFAALEDYSEDEVAAALGCTPETVANMMATPRPSVLLAWPSAGELLELQAAWQRVRPHLLADKVNLESARFQRAAAALKDLLDDRYQLREISAATGIRQRDLRRLL